MAERTIRYLLANPVLERAAPPIREATNDAATVEALPAAAAAERPELAFGDAICAPTTTFRRTEALRRRRGRRRRATSSARGAAAGDVVGEGGARRGGAALSDDCARSAAATTSSREEKMTGYLRMLVALVVALMATVGGSQDAKAVNGSGLNAQPESGGSLFHLAVDRVQESKWNGCRNRAAAYLYYMTRKESPPARLDLGWGSARPPMTQYRRWQNVFGQRVGYLREEVGLKILRREEDGRYNNIRSGEEVDREDFILPGWGHDDPFRAVLLRDSLVNQYWEGSKEKDRILAVEPAVDRMCSLARRVGSMFGALDSGNRGYFEMSLEGAEEVTRSMRTVMENRQERSNR